MPECNQLHESKNDRGETIYLQHEYRAGICILGVSETTADFLKATFSYYHGLDYKYSKEFHPTEMEYGQ